MRAESILFAASAIALITAQDLATALAGQESLTTLVGLLNQVPNTTEFLASQQDVTLFAPNNAALASILAEGGIFSIEQASVDPGLIEQILRYHLIRGAMPSSAVTEIPQFVPTFLNYSGFVLDKEVRGSNVTGGQVVHVSLDEAGDVIVTSGIKATSTVTVADIPFDNGVIHIIDKLLTIPLSIPATLVTGNFTALAGAATQAGLVTALEDASDITIFCPNNDAFQAIGGITDQLSLAQLISILEYHVVPQVVYSTDLSNTSLETTQGSSLKITIDADGAVFVDGARVINTDILIENGVVHVIDQVLSPATNDKQPTEVELSAAPASFVPFTSGIQPQTSVYSELSATTSLVAVGLFSATSVPSGGMPSAAVPSDAVSSGTMSSGATFGNGSVTTSGMPEQQTGNAAVRKEMPLFAAAAAMGVVALGMDL